MLLCVDEIKKTQTLLKMAKTTFGEVLSAFEFFDKQSMDIVVKHNKALSNPVEDSKFYILIETSSASCCEEMVMNFLEKLFEEDLVTDGTTTNNPTKIDEIWQLRERIAESLTAAGAAYKYDVSLPVEKMYDLVEKAQEQVDDLDNVKAYGYGHMGDGIQLCDTYYRQSALKYTC